MGGVLMSGERVPGGVLDPPRIGFVRVPLDIVPFFLLFAAGFFFGVSIGGILILFAVAAAVTGILRKKGDGFLRGWFFWQIAPGNRLWRPPVKRGRPHP